MLGIAPWDVMVFAGWGHAHTSRIGVAAFPWGRFDRALRGHAGGSG